MKGLLGWQGWCFWWGFLRPNKKLYTITFNVIPTDAIVILDGEQGTSFSEQGTIIFHKYAGNYAYSVSKTGYVTQAGTLNVSGDLVEKVTLILATKSIKYGYLYNWYAITNAKVLANTGWRVPTKTDQDTLMEYLTINGYNYNGSYNTYLISKAMADTGNNVYWTLSNSQGVPGNTDYPTFINKSKLGIRGTGWRNGSYSGLLNSCYLMTTSPKATYPTTNFYVLQLVYNSASTATLNYPRTVGGSVQLIKITTSLTDGQEGTYTGNDGRTYITICRGTQEWIKGVLAETKYRDGTLIAKVSNQTTWDGLSTGAYCAYGNDEANVFI
jgi:uncharacterized protein (TIGR02145 family)